LLENAFNRLEQEFDFKAGLMREFSLRAFSVGDYLNLRAKLLLKSEEPKKKSGSKKEKKPKKESAEVHYYGDNNEMDASRNSYSDEAYTESVVTVGSDITHPILYGQLTAWRRQEARELGRPAYTVLSQAALLGICRQPPVNTRELKKIRGIGPKTLEKYGERLMEIIDSYLGML
jgi:superfamily II DNA helicase RecQ